MPDNTQNAQGIDQTKRIPCPVCAELIMPAAKKCRFCGANLEHIKRIQRLRANGLLMLNRAKNIQMPKKDLLSLGLLVAALVSMAVFYLSGYTFYDIIWDSIFNSDNLFLHRLFFELFSNGGKLSDWYFPSVPFFFPDYLMFLGAYLFSHYAYIQIIVFAVIQSLLAFCLIWLVSGQVLKTGRVLSSVLATILLIWLAIYAGNPFVNLLSSCFHYGIFLSALLFTALWLKYENIEDPFRRKVLLLGMSLLAFLTSLSDTLFHVQTLVPFVAACFLINLINKNFSIKKYITPLIPVAFGGLGSFSYKFIVAHDTRYHFTISSGQLGTKLLDVLLFFKNLVIETPLYGLLFIIYIGFVFVFVLARRKSPKALVWLFVFTFLSLGSTICAICLENPLPFSPRYLTSELSWPVILMVFVTAYYLKERFYYLGVSVSAIVVVVLSVNAYMLAERNGISFRYYPPWISSIDDVLEKEELHNGISGYWDAKVFQSFSRLNINLAQYRQNLDEDQWITSDKYFRNHYDFAIIREKIDSDDIHQISPMALSRINGAPSKIVPCDGKYVYIYGKDKLRVRKIENPGDSYRWKGCELSKGDIGNYTPNCECEKKDITQSGRLTFGPYEALPSGKYSFEIGYMGSEGKSDTIGEWDVVIALPNEAKLLEKGVIVGSDSKANKISGVFTLEQKYNMKMIEIRTSSYEGKTLKVIYLQIKRLA